MSSVSPNEPVESGKKKGRPRGWFTRAQDWWYMEFRKIVGAWVFVVVVIGFGAVFVAAMDFTDYVFSTQTFCGTACHVMEINVYKELKQSKHWNTPTGVRALCADCHVGGRLSFAMFDHFVGTGELFVWLTHDLDKPGAFERLRPAGADRVRFEMIENDSARCRSCHVMEAIKPKRIRGQKQHEEALEEGITCIVCHYNLVHKEVEPSPAFQRAIEEARGLTGTEEEDETELAGEEEGEVL
jgi:nitrate/TMAO reductase-like tetraheme cytochrome c subunit